MFLLVLTQRKNPNGELKGSGCIVKSVNQKATVCRKEMITSRMRVYIRMTKIISKSYSFNYRLSTEMCRTYLQNAGMVWMP